MNITLPADLEQLVRERIERGDYENAADLVHEAVHRLVDEDEEEITALRALLQEADAEIDRGECTEYDEHTAKFLVQEIQDEVMVLEAAQKSDQG